MEKTPISKKSEDIYTIDIVRIFKCLWKKAWLIAIVSLIIAAISFSYAFFFVRPKYSSSVKLYVNNNSVSLGGSRISISSGDISASQSLIKTYIVILESRSTLKEVIKESGVDITVNELRSMIDASSVNDTEVMRVTVTAYDADEACTLANVIKDVLKEKIKDIIQNTEPADVDDAVPNYVKVSPSFSKYLLVGFLIGFIMSSVVIIIMDSLDDTIHDDDYIANQYDCPLLGKVQNLNVTGSKSYKYNYNYYYGRSSSSKSSSDNH
ncbi:MAG: hypothetical protein J5766_04320 [Clostridia bacterium]|nr:hypothetical protein [Clostridia bacterium]